MPFNVLLLPLLGGYLLISKWNLTRFDARRYSGNRLIFHAAIAGTVLLMIAVGTVLLVQEIDYLERFVSWWKEVVPFTSSGSSTIAFLLGVILPYGLNRLGRFDSDRQAAAAIQASGDYLEMLFQESLTEPRPVCVSFTCGKVYIGHSTSNFDPSFTRKYVTILPHYSGFRDPVTKAMEITTSYLEVFRDMNFPDEMPDFSIVIPVTEIESARLFDYEAYERFNPPPQPE